MSTARLMVAVGFVFASVSLLPIVGSSAAEQPIKYDLTGGVMDGPNLAYAMMRTFMTEDEWQQRVAECRKRFETWEHDNHGDMGHVWTQPLCVKAHGHFCQHGPHDRQGL